MSKIDDLIKQYCPDGVEYKALGEVVQKTKNIRWNEVADNEFQYIDLASVDRITHVVVETSTITKENAPSRAQQIVHEGDVIFGTTRPMLKRYTAISREYDGQICSTGFCVLRPDSKIVLTNYLYHIIGTTDFYKYVEKNERGASYPAISDKLVKEFKIPVPHPDVQEEIVDILDKFTKLEAELEAELEARKKQYNHYRDELLNFDDTVELTTLDKISRNLDSKRHPVTKSARTSGDIPYYGASGIVDYVSDYIFDGDYLLVSEDGANLRARVTPIAFSISGKAWVNNHAHILEFKSYAERRFAEIYLNSIDLSLFITGAAQPKINQANLNKIPIPNPPIEEQERVVAILDKFDALVNDISIGLPAEITARRQQYEHYRNQLLTFEEVA